MPRPNPIQRVRAIGVSRGVAMSADLLDGHVIISITDGSPLALVTTEGAHGLVPEDFITITGNSEAAYNDQQLNVDSVVSPTEFLIGIIFAGVGTGGTWALS